MPSRGTDAAHDLTWPDPDTHARVFLVGDGSYAGPPSFAPAPDDVPEATLPADAIEALGPRWELPARAVPAFAGGLLGAVLVGTWILGGPAPALVVATASAVAAASKLLQRPAAPAPAEVDVAEEHPASDASVPTVADVDELERLALAIAHRDEACAVLLLRRADGAPYTDAELRALRRAAADGPLAVAAAHPVDGACALVAEPRELPLLAPLLLRYVDEGRSGRSTLAAALVPVDAPTLADALRLPSLARVSAGGTVRFHDPDTIAGLGARAALRRELRRAIAGAEVRGAFQPMYAAPAGGMVGASLYVRWTHPDRGPIPPREVLALAEDHGVGADLTMRLLSLAARWAAEWRLSIAPAFTVTFHATSWQLADRWFPRLVEGALGRHQVPPDALWIEVDLDDALERDPGVVRRLGELAGLGAVLVVSGVTQPGEVEALAGLPFHAVQVDALGLAEGGADVAAAIRAVAAAAAPRGLSLVVQRIEDPEVLRDVRGTDGVVRVAGHALSPALSPERLGGVATLEHAS